MREDIKDMINIEKDKVTNIISDLHISDENKELMTNYILKNTLSDSPKYSCNLIENYITIDYINISLISIIIVILLYLLYKIYTKNNFNNIFI